MLINETHLHTSLSPQREGACAKMVHSHYSNAFLSLVQLVIVR